MSERERLAHAKRCLKGLWRLADPARLPEAEGLCSYVDGLLNQLEAENARLRAELAAYREEAE